MVLWDGVKCLFERLTKLYYIINIIIQSLHSSSFILIYVDILHIVNIVMLRWVFPYP